MKKLIVMLANAIAAAMPIMGATWYDSSTGYTWRYRINGNTAEIYNNGSAAAISPSPTGAVTIPDTLGGKSVTRIGRYALSCSGLTSVTIPDSVTSIGDYAFESCSGLTAVYITDLASWCGISFGSGVANPLYYAHNLYLNDSLVTDLVIPDSVTSIGNNAFSSCSGLTSVTIPNSVISIGERAFGSCDGLTSVTIPDSVTSIGDGAFDNCDGLTSVTIGIGVTNIGDGAFEFCEGLTSVTISSGVTSIGDWAFYKSGLTSVTIPNSVTNIGDHAFEDCDGLTSVTIGSGVTSIGDEAFLWCRGLTSVTIPNSVTNIGSHAFRGCSGLSLALVPAQLNGSVLQDNQFSNCAADLRIVFYDDDILVVVSFDANGGVDDLLFVNAPMGYAIGSLPSPSRPNHRFLGWFTAQEGGEQVTAETVVNENITLYAHWEFCEFDFSGNADWAKQTDGSWKSGTITHGQKTSIRKTVMGKGTLSFQWKVSSESGYDKLTFYIDWTAKDNISGTSGGWVTKTYVIDTIGTHTLTWTYAKDEIDSSGSDCGWIRDVVWTPDDVTVDMGDGKTVTVPGTWLSENTTRTATDTAANGRMSVAECYVVGLDPEIATNDFAITAFPMKADGTPDLDAILSSIDPPQSKWNVSGARPVLKGAASLDAKFEPVTEQNKSSFRFFTVEVELP